jgi:hypothetical protein
MLEHVPDPSSIIKACSVLVKADGQLFFSTLNRNAKSYLFAIIGAEYILKLLPQGTHDWDKFIKPSEMDEWARHSDLTLKSMTPSKSASRKFAPRKSTSCKSTHRKFTPRKSAPRKSAFSPLSKPIRPSLIQSNQSACLDKISFSCSALISLISCLDYF